jgi:hypothetical protein
VDRGLWKETTTRATEGYHKIHLLRLLGEKLEIEAVEFRHVQKYANGRLGEEWRGKPIGSATVLKEVATLRVIWNLRVCPIRLSGRVEWCLDNSCNAAD